MDAFLDDLERCLTRHLGSNWDYSFERTDDGIDLSLRAWGDLFREPQPYEEYEPDED